MIVKVNDILVVRGDALEPNWSYPVQIVGTDKGMYINTPEISKDIFKEGMEYSVGLGNLFGKTGKEYRTINIRS